MRLQPTNHDTSAASVALPGHSVVLSCEAAGRRRTFHVQLVAPVTLHGDLLVAWPALPGADPVALDAGQAVLVELASPYDALYLADARVADEQPWRPAALALDTTGPWQRVQHRHDVRWPVTIVPREIAPVQGGPSPGLRAEVADVSASGLRLRADRELPRQQVLIIEFALPGDSQALRVQARVEWTNCLDDSAAPLWEVGCRFIRPSERDGDRIVRFIFAEQRRLARGWGG